MSIARKESKKRRNTDWLATVAVLGAMLVAIFYYIDTFCTVRSANEAIWGSFGDYFGGIMNPFIGLVTVLLVLRTLEVSKEEAETTRLEMKIQNDLLQAELEEARGSARLQEIERCMSAIIDELRASLGGEIDEGFPIGMDDSESPVYATTPRTKASVVGHRWAVSRIDNAMLADQNKSGNASFRQVLRRTWEVKFSREISLVSELSVYCSLYERRSITHYALNYYKNRASDIANCLFSLELINQAQWDILTPVGYAKDELSEFGDFDRPRSIWISRPAHEIDKDS